MSDPVTPSALATWLQGAPLWARAAIAFTGSLLCALGTPPDGHPLLIWLGFLPLTIVARTSGHLGWGRLLLVGVIGGLCSGLVGFPWVGETLVRFGEFHPAVAYGGLFAFAVWTGIPFGLWMVVVARSSDRGPWSLVWPCVAWVGVAKIWPDFFPYTAMIGLAQTPTWMQAAELGGVALVEMQVVLVGVLLAEAALDSHRRRSLIRVGAALGLVLASHGLGSWRMAVIDAEAAQAPSIRFGIIQPNTALLSVRGSEKMRRLWSQSAMAEAEGAEAIVWPEAGIYPYGVERPWTHDFDGYRKVLREHQLPTILGVASRKRGDKYEWNTAVVMNAQGEVVGSFDKNVLVPFGEYIPVVDPDWATEQIPAMSHNHAGEGPARFPLELTRGETYMAGPLICYEDIFDDFAHTVATQDGGIEVFVNVTIDTWFGDTAEPWEHLALAQFRSVEHRIPMVRSVAAGASSYVDATGRLAASLPVTNPLPRAPVPEARLVVDVPVARNTAQRPTFYARGGWLVGWLCVFAVGVVPLAAWVRKKYSPRQAS